MFQLFVLWFIIIIFIITINGASTDEECEQKGIGAAGTGDIESLICDTDNCRVSLSGWDHRITVNITCPYASITAIASGSGHVVTINCFNCYISPRGNLQIINNTDINSTQFNSIGNCACSGMTECQLSTTDDPCINSENIHLTFESTTKNEQYMECQRACYDNNRDGTDCLYGIYYSFESQECRFITGACNWFDDIENDEYHFVSKGCMSYSNGSFSAVSFPQNNVTGLKASNEVIIIVVVLIAVLFILAFIVFIFYRMRIANNGNKKSEATKSETKSVNNVMRQEQLYAQQNQQYPMQQSYVQQNQQSGGQIMVKLPDGSTAMAQIVAPVGNVVAYQPQPSAPIVSNPDENQQAPEYQPEGVNNNATFQ